MIRAELERNLDDFPTQKDRLGYLHNNIQLLLQKRETEQWATPRDSDNLMLFLEYWYRLTFEVIKNDN